MRDSVFFSLLALAALAVIALALVWPQGQGARSPPPFGHPLARVYETPTNGAAHARDAPGHF
jgi:hypothetical protein